MGDDDKDSSLKRDRSDEEDEEEAISGEQARMLEKRAVYIFERNLTNAFCLSRASEKGCEEEWR